jgi:hypothetical protein
MPAGDMPKTPGCLKGHDEAEALVEASWRPLTLLKCVEAEYLDDGLGARSIRGGDWMMA